VLPSSFFTTNPLASLLSYITHHLGLLETLDNDKIFAIVPRKRRKIPATKVELMKVQ
jgi:hypothetical protein